MPLASDISIKYNGADITHKVLYSRTHFTSQANPIQGGFQVAVKDLDQTFNPVSGKVVTLHLDGVPMVGGYVTRVSRQLFFPVVDTSTPGTVSRLWVLTGPDFNVLFDKRILRDFDNPTAALVVPSGKRTVKKAFNHLMANYIDVPPGLTYFADVDDVDTNYGDDTHGGLYVGQGKTWRDQMEDFADNAGLIYYIDADKSLHMHEYETQRVPWLFVDSHPNGTSTIGFREGEYSEDFQRVATEALVWGGSSYARPGQPIDDPVGIGVVFARYPDPPANDATWHGKLQSAQREQNAINRQNTYGLWQVSEMNVGQSNYLTKGSVKNRAFVMINGPAGTVPTLGIEGGFSQPLKGMQATWFGHDVPSGQHVRAGYLHDFILYTQGPDGSTPLVFSLPLRSMKITFPTLPSDNPSAEMLTYVRFDGSFGSSYGDSRHLWKAMKRRDRQARERASRIIARVSDQLTDVPSGAEGDYGSLDTPDGVRRTFNFAVSFWTGAQVYINGLLQRTGIDYTWTTASQITFFGPLGIGDDLHVYGQVSP